MAKVEVKVLPSVSMGEAIEQAKGIIQTERSGTINGLYTRFPKLNSFLMKYWRFGTVTAMAGMSGSGKSAILNMIEDDFTNPEMNPTFLRHRNSHGDLVGEDKIMVLAFKYEMDAADEVLRNLSGKVKKSYAYLLSSQKAKEDGLYNTVKDSEYDVYCQELDKLASRPIRFIENAGNLEQMYATCAYYKEKYPTKRLIVTIDHTLLTKKLSEKDDLELTAATAQMAIRLRKTFGALVIFLSQLNGEIEKPLRRTTLSLQFPVKTDIHCGNQLFWACDNVIIWHRPEILGIEKYGHFLVNKEMISVNAKGIIHGCCIKSRKNTVGNLWFLEQFGIGGMAPINAADIRAAFNPKLVT